MIGKYKIIAAGVVLLVVLISSSAMAGYNLRIGTAGAQELRIPIGSRGTALGGAISADITGTEAIYYNPAGVALIDGTEVMFSHLSYFADISLNYIAVTHDIEDFGSIGISAKILSVGGIEKTMETSPEGTGEIFSPTLSVFGLTFSKILTDRVTFGVTGKYIYESIDLVSAGGVAFDFGINYDTKWHNIRLGFVIKNIGPEMRFSGPGFERDGYGDNQNAGSPEKTLRTQPADFELPSWIEFSTAFDLFRLDKNRGSLFGAFQSNNFSEDLYRAGAEYVYDDNYFLRAGYTFDAGQEDYLYGMTFGGGINIMIGATNVTFEYSWNETSYFDNNQYLTGKINF